MNLKISEPDPDPENDLNEGNISEWISKIEQNNPFETDQKFIDESEKIEILIQDLDHQNLDRIKRTIKTCA